MILFYYIRKSSGLPYVTKNPSGQDAHNVQRKAAAQPHIDAQSVQVPHE